MNRCPNHKCRQKYDTRHAFCRYCGISVKLCAGCQQTGKLTVNRADGFYCRRCGSVLPAPRRNFETEMLFSPTKENFLTPPARINLSERSDSFPLVSSQSTLWLLTSNNNLHIITNRAAGLDIYSRIDNRFLLDELQSAIKYLDPLSPPVLLRDRLLLFGSHKILSFSIHPHENRWLQDRHEIALPEEWQPLFNSETGLRGSSIEVPMLLGESGQALIAKLPYQVLSGQAPFTAQISNSIAALPIAPLDLAGQYYWAKDLKHGTGLIFYLQRRESGLELRLIHSPPLLFFVRPIMVGERVYAITEENRLVELALQQGEVIQQRKLSQVNRGARLMVIARDKIAVVVHEAIMFFDFQTGELLSVAPDIDPSHLFVDNQGRLLAIHRNGQMIMINSAQPLERWGNEDATIDDSRVFDAFIAHNSLYTLSENGEVCRFDFN